MYPVSNAFVAAITNNSAPIATYAAVLQNGVVIYAGLVTTKGKVTIDRSASQRRTCNVTLIDPSGTLTPKAAGDLLSPYGNEIILYRGFYYTPGAPIAYPTLYVAGQYELCPLGVFRISTSTITDDGLGGVSIEVRGYDRSRQVAREDFVDVYPIATDTNVNTAIQDIVSPRVPLTCQFNLFPTSVGTPAITHGISDTTNPWTAVTQLEGLVGGQLYFDYFGNLVSIPEPLPGSQPVIGQIVEGDGSLLSVKREETDEKIYNDIIVHNEGTSTKVVIRGRAYDNDSGSPTYINGPFGDIPKHIRSPLASDTATATTMASAMLKQYLGKLDQVTLTVVCNPSLDVNDVIYVKRAASGLDDNYIIDAITVPMEETGSQTITVRAASSASIGTSS